MTDFPQHYRPSPSVTGNLGLNRIQPRSVSNLFLCISMEILLAFFASYCRNAVILNNNGVNSRFLGR